jgi:S1-C subfamily serine protease
MGDTAFIGVGIADAQDGGPAGAVVRQVLPDTAARGAGLAPGDIITGVDGVAINTATDLSNVMDAHHPGDTITLNWVDREGNPRSAPLVLGSGQVG